ncbi:patatin-like phospholipase family protein [Devosia sp. LjRoot3]|uniref:patatin-like phospholipase family protein n=1 Tax=Devosia sp. LjRoot3 TaxID=3342319 RepID=UPI003ECD62A7
MARRKIGVALGSGAARGWAHIGVLEVLAEAGIGVDVVCGTSMGAMVGAAFASDRLDAMKQWAIHADWWTVASLVDFGVLAGGLVDGDRIVNWMAGLGVTGQIGDMARPFAAVATNLSTGQEVCLAHGSVQAAVRASIALPGIFSPMILDGDPLVDGGLVNPVPVSACRSLGADFIIAVSLHDEVLGQRLARKVAPAKQTSGAPGPLHPGPKRTLADHARAPIPGYFEVLTGAINIMQDQITRSKLAGDPPHAQILPLVAHIGLLDFHCAKEAIAAGRSAATQSLPMIKDRLNY